MSSIIVMKVLNQSQYPERLDETLRNDCIQIFILSTSSLDLNDPEDSHCSLLLCPQIESQSPNSPKMTHYM